MADRRLIVKRRHEKYLASSLSIAIGAALVIASVLGVLFYRHTTIMITLSLALIVVALGLEAFFRLVVDKHLDK